jgi:hypothetical protein
MFGGRNWPPLLKIIEPSKIRPKKMQPKIRERL